MIKRILVAVAAACIVAFAASPASATSPDPYNTTTGTASLAVTTIGGSACSLSDVAANISGGRGSITGFRVDACSGLLTEILSNLGILISITLNPVAIAVTFLGITIRNAFGGICLYTGTLTGTGSGSNASVIGQLNLNPARSGGTMICNDPASVRLDVTFPGLTL